eukprot:11419490-Alexandrium_andersonii.AAC.1
MAEDCGSTRVFVVAALILCFMLAEWLETKMSTPPTKRLRWDEGPPTPIAGSCVGGAGAAAAATLAAEPKRG